MMVLVVNGLAVSLQSWAWNYLAQMPCEVNADLSPGDVGFKVQKKFNFRSPASLGQGREKQGLL